MADAATLTRDQLDSLANHIAQLSLRIDLAKHALLTALRQFVACEGWAGSGFPSLPAWLSWRIGISPTTAREYVRVAKALGEFPHIDAAFARGELSYAKVRALTRAANPATERDLVDIALHATAAQIETTCAAYRRTRVDPPCEEGAPARPDLRRFMHRTTTASGMVRIELQLAPEQAEVVWAAMHVALDGGRAADGRADADADANADASEEASAPSQTPTELAPRELDPSERVDALVSVAQAFLEQRNRPHGTGFELVLMTTPDQLEAGPGGVGGFFVRRHAGAPARRAHARLRLCARRRRIRRLR
jgi:hypothetical protein